MTTFIIRRFLQSLLFILIGSLAVYTVLVMFMPSGPYQSYARLTSMPQATSFGPFGQPTIPSDLARAYKVDKPWPLNFLLWLFDPSDTTQLNGQFQEVPKGINATILGLHITGAGILTGDWGKSDSYARSEYVTKILGDRWANTAWLVGSALVVSIAIALPLGIVAAVRRRTFFDHAFTFLSFAGLSIPPFVFGLLLIMAFAIIPKLLSVTAQWSWLPYLPGGGVYTVTNDTAANRAWHLILPVTALAIPQIAWLSRYVRISMLDVLTQDYIRTAWAKGLSRRRVIVKHAFRNALIPIITVVGLALPTLASGAIVVESVFGYTGMGQLYYRAIGGCLATQSVLLSDRPPCNPMGFPPDYPLALVMTVMLVVIVAFSNFLADFLYAVADPRVNYTVTSQP